jgi:hypothetical protein
MREQMVAHQKERIMTMALNENTDIMQNMPQTFLTRPSEAPEKVFNIKTDKLGSAFASINTS